MNQKTVYQYDLTGRFVGECLADESPREPNVWMMPARTVVIPPPDSWPDGFWPRWNGGTWEITGTGNPKKATPEDPVAKLQAFLQANPDVAALMP